MNKKIKFFADTASLDEIAYSFSRGVNDGITTNPKIMEDTGDLSLGFECAGRAILETYPNVPVSLETDLAGIDSSEIYNHPERVRDVLLKQANDLSTWRENVVVKIPICEGGILATKDLSDRGVKTNVTACMTPYQALTAADAGATYVSLFANRMMDSRIIELAGLNLERTLDLNNWKDILADAKLTHGKRAWKETLEEISYVAKHLDDSDSELIVGSIRSPENIYDLVRCGPQVITIPTKIVEKLEGIIELKYTKRNIEPGEVTMGESLNHPMTHHTIVEFEKAADSYRKK